MGAYRSVLAEVDPDIAAVLEGEERRQRDGLELIASENFVSAAVLEAMGSVLTNKYAEGYPGRRYYGGCVRVDEAERLAIERAKAIFGAEHVNAQPHSGAQANMAVYEALLKPGDTVLGMNLAQGGHLTHGSPLNFSGMHYRFVHYGVRRDTELIDHDEVVRLTEEHRPKMIVAGASAYPRLIDFDRFRQAADSVGALLMVDMAHIAGLVAARLHPDPCAVADVVTTTTHKTLRGPRGGLILCRQRHAAAIDKALFPGVQGGPLMHVIAAKAVCLAEAARPDFVDYQTRVIENARVLASELVGRGFRAVTGGTDTHLALLDMSVKGLTGRETERVLERAGITVNKNLIPYDTQKPLVASGIRIGSPAVTSRGMGPGQMCAVGALIGRAIELRADEAALDRLREEVAGLAASFPLRAGPGGF